MAPPFRFSPYHSEATSTIAGLLSQEGQGAANAARTSGNAWGSAIQNIGQQVAAIPQQVAKQKAAQTEQATADLQLTQAKRVEGARNALATVMKDAPKLSEDGVSVWDVGAIAKGMTDAGYGPEGSAAAQHINAVNDAFRQARAAQIAVVKTGAQSVIAAGNDPALAAHFIDQLEANKLYPADTIKEYRDFIAKDPANVAKLTSYLAGPQKLENAAPGSSMRNPLTGQVVEGSTVADPKAEEAAKQAAARQAELERHNKELEAISKLTAGRAEAQAREIARHNRATEATAAVAANPLGGMLKGGPAATAGAAAVSGDDFLKTLDPGVASEVKAYAEGRRPFPTGMSMAKLQPLIQLVGQYDPTFDAANYNARNKARTDMLSPSGTAGKTINAVNTAIQHAGKLSDLIEQLDNSNYPTVNAIKNPIRSMAGSTKVTNFEAVAPQLAKEMEKAWRAAGGTGAEVQALVDSIGKNLGKAQQQQVLGQFVDLLKGKLDATQQQRDNVMGATAGASIPILFKQNEAILKKIEDRASGTTVVDGYTVGVK